MDADTFEFTEYISRYSLNTATIKKITGFIPTIEEELLHEIVCK